MRLFDILLSDDEESIVAMAGEVLDADHDKVLADYLKSSEALESWIRSLEEKQAGSTSKG